MKNNCMVLCFILITIFVASCGIEESPTEADGDTPVTYGDGPIVEDGDEPVADGDGGGNTWTIDTNGGVIETESGITVTIPAGAVDGEIEITVETVSNAETGEAAAASEVFRFGPKGTIFAVPVTIELPYDPGALDGNIPSFFWTIQGDETTFEDLPGASFSGGVAMAEVDHFSLGFVGFLPPVEDGDEMEDDPDVTDDPVEDGDETEDDQPDPDGDEMDNIEDDEAEALVCMSAEECPEGLGCHMGFCGMCDEASECRDGEGCIAGVCGACQLAEHCAEGFGCIDGICAACEVLTDCREGEACITGVCGACEEAQDCAGMLCVEGECVVCEPEPETREDLCGEQYQPGWVCLPEGICTPPTCLTDTDCYLLGQVCKEHHCTACEDNFDCVPEGEGGYPEGTSCIDGICVEADCLNDTVCPDDRPICGDRSKCRGCQRSFECLRRHNADSGYICDRDTGRCEEGNCYPAGEACDPEDVHICGENFRCRPCEGDQECRESLATDVALCDDGTCITGCDPVGSTCDETQICGDDHRCRMCAGDTECSAALGNDSGICEGGECLVGCTAPAINDDGQLCGEDHRWMACATDAECVSATSDDNAICTDGRCITGCDPVGSACNETQICGDDHRCRVCESDAECSAALGNDAGICEGGECLVGCTAPAINDDGQLCGEDHRYYDCAEDRQCIAASGGDQNAICVDNRCTVGCATNAECPENGICDLSRCRACQNDIGATADDCQANGYGAGVLCVSGECVDAECNEVSACANNRACFEGACVDCTELEQEYCLASGNVCDATTNTCVECVTNGDCSGSEPICTDHECRACAESSECGEGFVCATSGACLEGDCYINSTVYNNGDTDPSNVCNVCNSLVNPLLWSANAGTSCDDGNDCSYDDECSAVTAGSCSGIGYSCPGNQCAEGVCHGTGFGDCTLEKDPGWTGCFLDDTCYVNNAPKPGNSCQYCDGSANAWANKVAGTDCGFCKFCEESGGVSTCVDVPQNEDPNDDCSGNCEVCNGDEDCQDVTGNNTDPNDDCTDEGQASCGQNGFCSDGTGVCANYSENSGVGTVDDGNYCTIDDYCDGAGNKTGDSGHEGEICGDSITGACDSADECFVCDSGQCADCDGSNPCPEGHVCDGGSCFEGDCASETDCTDSPPACKKYVCTNHTCTLVNDNTASCSDGNDCTYGDHCNNGECEVTPHEPENCDDGLICTIDSCLSNGSCSNARDPNYCYMGGQCYAHGDPRNPADDLNCDTCDSSNNSWNKSCGFLTNNSNATCNSNGVCVPNTDYCIIGTTVYQTGDYNGSENNHSCDWCQSSSDQYAWTEIDTDNTESERLCNTTGNDKYCDDRGGCTSRFEEVSECVRLSRKSAGTRVNWVPCIIDWKTKRMWAFPSSCTTTKEFSEAVSYCNLLGTDWSLPSKTIWQELATSISAKTTDCDGGGNTIKLDSAFHGEVNNLDYWTTTNRSGFFCGGSGSTCYKYVCKPRENDMYCDSYEDANTSSRNSYGCVKSF